jgi:siroheme synthase
MSITIVGLGPGDPRHLTREAWGVLLESREVWLRTARHPTVPPSAPPIWPFAPLTTCTNPRRISLRSTRPSRSGSWNWATGPKGWSTPSPGHPLVGEATVRKVLQMAREAGLPTRVVDGVSFVEVALTALGLDALEPGIQVCDGIEIAALHHPPLNPDLPALIGQVYSRRLASDLKLTLMNQYPDEHPVTLIFAAGTDAQRLVHLPLYELDRQEVDHLTTLYVPPLPPVSSFEGFQETVAHLRAPDGCPWDREQTHESLREQSAGGGLRGRGRHRRRRYGWIAGGTGRPAPSDCPACADGDRSGGVPYGRRHCGHRPENQAAPPARVGQLESGQRAGGADPLGAPQAGRAGPGRGRRWTASRWRPRRCCRRICTENGRPG